MSTTPRSSSPVKQSLSQDEVAGDQSMMVELPTHLGDQTELVEPEEDVTVKLHSQSQPQSPPRKVDQVQDMSALARNIDRQRQTRTPDAQKRRSNRSEMQSPGHIVAFDWEDFEDRYEKALQEADEQEKQLLEEFETLVKYFNVWASASSAHDNERAVKRLQTRERHVRLSEQALLQKKQHLSEVVKAFQSALALLRST
ncbi:uncharacterized protein F4812DRAFT_438899 [Daldinia caldariorum]|uniref:uncharacterized protein n=1 Tax=Daldinia caldariorum TaxID=326644 RepID=UPI00200800FC|nr:uncharacterized protein F4812DRAFT_438899 [Daldinia caldariorum]KAI1465477.1 hypothetical protein F4812DRAFT_438899 [Daldinia caldariorum]